MLSHSSKVLMSSFFREQADLLSTKRWHIDCRVSDTVPDLIDGNGYLLQNFGDKDEIKKTMTDFLALPNDEKCKMGNRSEQILRAKATLDNMTNQHVAAVERAINYTINK